jgi:hypothetical protein
MLIFSLDKLFFCLQIEQISQPPPAQSELLTGDNNNNDQQNEQPSVFDHLCSPPKERRRPKQQQTESAVVQQEEQQVNGEGFSFAFITPNQSNLSANHFWRRVTRSRFGRAEWHLDARPDTSLSAQVLEARSDLWH